MSYKANAAYEGVHKIGSNREVRVAYYSKAALASVNQGVAPFMPAYKKFGWYWSPAGVQKPTARDLHGPYTSSRLALAYACGAEKAIPRHHKGD